MVILRCSDALHIGLSVAVILLEYTDQRMASTGRKRAAQITDHGTSRIRHWALSLLFGNHMRIWRSVCRWALRHFVDPCKDAPPLLAKPRNEQLLNSLLPQSPEFARLRELLHALFPYSWCGGAKMLT